MRRDKVARTASGRIPLRCDGSNNKSANYGFLFSVQRLLRPESEKRNPYFLQADRTAPD